MQDVESLSWGVSRRVHRSPALRSMPSTDLCYSSRCNINVHLLFHPLSNTVNNLRTKSMVHTPCDANTKPRDGMRQKMFSRKKEAHHFTFIKPYQIIIINICILKWARCSDCLTSCTGGQTCTGSGSQDSPLHHGWTSNNQKGKKPTIGHWDQHCTKVRCFSNVVRILNGIRTS